MNAQRGFSMIEVLVTILILAVGLLGLAGLQARTMSLEMESYQRSQALVLLNDMTSRLEGAVTTSGAAYVTASPLGTGDEQETDCTGAAVGVARDHCEWSNMLKGAAESAGGSNVGAMIGARGCITQIQAPDPAVGTCTPGIYEVAVAWQGMFDTVAPSIDCGDGEYSSEEARRVVSLRVVAATTGCTL
jgi:type IV pilus assembly protein PilV